MAKAVTPANDQPQTDTTVNPTKKVPHAVGKFARWRERINRALDRMEGANAKHIRLEIGGGPEQLIVFLGIRADGTYSD